MVLLLWFFNVFFLSCVCCAFVRVCLYVPCDHLLGKKGLTYWLSFVVSYWQFVTFPMVHWVRCGTWLYRFLIFAPLLTLICLEIMKNNEENIQTVSRISRHCLIAGRSIYCMGQIIDSVDHILGISRKCDRIHMIVIFWYWRKMYQIWNMCTTLDYSRWTSQNAEKFTHIKVRLLDQAVILFNCVPLQNGNFS